jgi:hypothetical protein
VALNNTHDVKTCLFEESFTGIQFIARVSSISVINISVEACDKISIALCGHRHTVKIDDS